MLNAVKRSVTVQRGGRIELHVPELPGGSIAEVIILEGSGTVAIPGKLAAVVGQGKRAFVSATEADSFIRCERDRWS